MLYRDIIELETAKGISAVEITEKVVQIVRDSKISDGTCSIFLGGTTAGLMLNENDRFLIEDFKRLFREFISEDRIYSHSENAFSHMRAASLSPSLTMPISRNKLILGEWQSILLWEFDTKPRNRQVVVTISGD